MVGGMYLTVLLFVNRNISVLPGLTVIFRDWHRALAALVSLDFDPLWLEPTYLLIGLGLIF